MMNNEKAAALAPTIKGRLLRSLDDLERQAFDLLQANGLAEAVAAYPDSPTSTDERVALYPAEAAKPLTISKLTGVSGINQERFHDSVVLNFQTDDGQPVCLTLAHLVVAVAELEKEGAVPPLEGHWIERTRSAYGIAE